MPQRPDWVICGIPWDNDKVAILASTELSHAELETKADDIHVEAWEFVRPTRTTTRYALVVHMRSFVIVVADTYEQAFRSLFEQWTPQRQTQIAGHQPQISDGVT